MLKTVQELEGKMDTLAKRRPLAHRPHMRYPLRSGPDKRTPPIRGAMHRPPAPMQLPRLPPLTHAARAHPVYRHGPSTHALAGTEGQGNTVFCICQPCARDSGNKIAASAHGMGSGGLAADAMAIGCLGVDRRGERFFVLSHFRLGSLISADPREAAPLVGD